MTEVVEIEYQLKKNHLSRVVECCIQMENGKFQGGNTSGGI